MVSPKWTSLYCIIVALILKSCLSGVDTKFLLLNWPTWQAEATSEYLYGSFNSMKNGSQRNILIYYCPFCLLANSSNVNFPYALLIHFPLFLCKMSIFIDLSVTVISRPPLQIYSPFILGIANMLRFEPGVLPIQMMT